MKICLFGDSVSKGIIYDNNKKRYTKGNSFIKQFCNKNNIELDDNSRFGCTIEKAKEMVLRRIDSLKNYDYILLMLGGNDCNFNWEAVAKTPNNDHKSKLSPDEFKENYIELINIIKKYNNHIVIFNMIPVVGQMYLNYLGSSYGKEELLTFLKCSETIEHYNEMFNYVLYDISRICQVEIIDVRSCLLWIRDLSKYYSIDGIHPNQVGYDFIFKNIESNLSNVLNMNFQVS